VFLILIAFALRSHNLGGREFWFDEAVSANVSSLGWEGALTHLRSEPFEHPPLYYLALYPWQQLVGTSEFAFRFFSVFWGVLFVPLQYILVKRLTKRRSEQLGRLAAFLAAVSPFLVAYSQEARMYTLVPCLALLVLLTYQSALERKRHPVGWPIYVLLMAVGLATHYFFALIWVTITIDLLLTSLQEQRIRKWGLVVQGLVLLTVVIWLVAAPGLRSSLARIWEGEAVFSLAYKLDKIMPTLMLADTGGGAVPLAAHVLAFGGWLLVLLGAWWSRAGRVLTVQAWRLLLLLLAVPLVASLLIPYHVIGRHLAYTLTALLIFIALALTALKEWGRPYLAAGTLACLLFLTYGLVVHYGLSNGHFGQAMDYIDRRAQPGDVLVLSQPAQHPLVTYYNDGSWPVRYVPPGTVPPTPGEVADYLGAISYWRSRLWLGPLGAWTADPEHLVGHWLATNAFQAEKTWLPDSSSVALYLNGDADLAAAGADRFTWGGKIRMVGLMTSPLELVPGEAIRLRFHWQASMDLERRYAVLLSLTDGRDLVWAERRSEPCCGWCPTDRWSIGHLQQDQHALLIPPGTPPGSYHLNVAWIPLDGGAPLQAEEEGRRVEQVTAADVTVRSTMGQAEEPWILPNALQATFGQEITLLGYEPAEIDARVGESLHLETHWRAQTAPTGSYILVMELLDRAGQVTARWESMPSSESDPTDLWRVGDYRRGQHQLPLPSTLEPGDYRLQISLVSSSGARLELSGENPRELLGGLVTWRHPLDGRTLPLASVQVVDRPRMFALPAMDHPLDVTVGRRAHLVGYDLDLSQAHPSGQVHLTLYWQASGPMVRPFKVFTHLIDDRNTIWAQHDASPGAGCCPANTWVEGEVIVDDHTLSLGADLPPGTYSLVAGLYDEATANRLPVYDFAGNPLPDDRMLIEIVTLEPGSVDPSTGPQVRLDCRLYIPLLRRSDP
jgi:hypothetical protein